VSLDPWYLEHIVCPRDYCAVKDSDGRLVCNQGHAYPVVDGVPVMLLDDVPQTIGIAETSIESARAARSVQDESPIAKLYLETLGLGSAERESVKMLAMDGRCPIDPVVAYAVAATNGNMYKHLIGKLNTYPIPGLLLPAGRGELLLDVGCSWGRWSVAAARKGYAVVGIDPSLGAVMAARRVSESLGLSIKHVVADGRFLPFPNATFDRAFSYSVIQHFSPEDARSAVCEIGRTLKTGGSSVLQFPTVLGVRCLYQQVRRRFREPVGFEVRYWTIPALKKLLAAAVGPNSISVDCFFGIGLQESDAPLMPIALRTVLAASKALRKASTIAPFLTYLADSVYVTAVKQ